MSNPDLKTDQGFSAIELMISQTLGMLVITAFIALLAPAILALGKNNTVSMQQESLRFANDYPGRLSWLSQRYPFGFDH